MFPNFPKIPGIVSTLGGTDTWYDRAGNQVDPDPFNQNEIFDATGQRHVFVGGTWEEDDPRVSKLFPYAMGALVTPYLLPASGSGFMLSAGFYGGLEPIFGQGPSHNQTYHYMNPSGNYLSGNGTEITPDNYQWLIRRWGENPPNEAIEKWEAEHLADIFEADLTEYETLDDLAYQSARYENQGLVKIGKPISPGDTFYINGQRAVLGTKAPSGSMQYAVTEPGSGDRWKYKITKDPDGNFVRTYYRTYGAKREKQERLKRKGKDE